MSEAIVITASPVLDTDSRRACSGRGQLFDGLFEGRLIITRSSQPLLDRARALLAKGIDPRTRILMRHVGADADALRSTVGRAAKLSIREGDDAPRFKDCRPARGRRLASKRTGCCPVPARRRGSCLACAAAFTGDAMIMGPRGSVHLPRGPDSDHTE
jgi:hypothetical protein